MTSSSLYDTFGNKTEYDVLHSTLEVFLKNSTIPFSLPQASASILGNLGNKNNFPINAALLDQVEVRLQDIGFQEANARSLAIVLVEIAETQGISPLEYFTLNEKTLKLTKDSYNAINGLRPVGNRIGIVIPKFNNRNALVQP